MKQRLLSSVSQIALRGSLWGIAAMALAAPLMPSKAEIGQQAAGPVETGGKAPGLQAAAPEGSEISTARTPPGWVLAHGPYTHWYPDTTQLVKDRTAAAEESAWKDVIGTREFDTKGIAAHWDGNTLNLAIFTNFPDRNVKSAGRMVAPADLALDLDGDGTLETGVVLSAVPSTGDRGVVRAANIRKGAAYRVTKWLKPDDILVHTYGEGWRWAGLTGDELAYAAVPVWVGEGTERDDMAVTVDWRVNGRGSDYIVLVTLNKTTGDNDLSNLPIIWGTAVCGNDVVFAPLARIGDLLEQVARTDEGERADSADGGRGVSNDSGVPAGTTVNTGRTISEGTFGPSAESTPAWNRPYPAVFPGSTGGNSPSGTYGGGFRPGGTTGGPVGPGWSVGPGGSTHGGGGAEEVTQVPEPPTIWLLGTALAGYISVLLSRRRKQRKSDQV